MIYTIGHSTHSIDDFLAAIDIIDVVADVRSHPGSKANPQYNQEAMIKWVPAGGKRYEWWPELGGWRGTHAELITKLLADIDLAKYGVDITKYGDAFPKQHISGSTSATTGWTNMGLNDYQWFTALEEFQVGIDNLLGLGCTKNVVLVCCEALWYKCHRSMIADHIVWRGGSVQHIMPRFRKIKKPRCVVNLVDHKQFADTRLAAYEPAVIELWKKHHQSLS